MMIRKNSFQPTDGICLGVVLFNPEKDTYLTSLSEAISAGICPIVFDNSSEEKSCNNRRAIEDRNLGRHVEYIASGSNVGLAAAYNAIVKVVLEKKGAEGIIFLDQDSLLSKGSIERLISSYRKAAPTLRIGVLAGMPMRRDGRPYRVYARRSGKNLIGNLVLMRTVPSSFSLVPVSAIVMVGNFHDDFFIDQIDRDFCYRCHRAGLYVVMEPEAMFGHSVGEGCVELWGRYIGPISSPFRHYFQIRNLVLSARRGGVPWGVALQQILKRIAMIGVVAIVAGGIVIRYRFAFHGLKDGLLNRGGPLL